MLNRLKSFLAGGCDEADGAGAPDGSRQPRILIVRSGAIGDTLMTTPLIRALRHAFPEAYLTFLCSNGARDVLAHNRSLDRVAGLAYRHAPAALSPEKRHLIASLRELHLDCAIVLESHPSFLDLARRVQAKRVVAYGVLEGTHIDKAGFDPKRHSIENHLRVGEDFLGAPSAGLEMELYYPEPVRAAVAGRLAQAGIQPGDIVVGLHAGWGGRAQSFEETRLRSWPPQRFAAVARWLVESAGARVVLTGSSNDRPLNQYIAAQASVPCLDLAGSLSVLELAALIGRFNAYVSIDSGPAHMAAALGTPLICLWGPGIFEQTRPLTERGIVRLIRHAVPCAPCYGTPLLKQCTDNICMKRIEVEEVREAVTAALAHAAAKRIPVTGN